ncbi:indole-3-glycerol phosphate synthase TrpC [Pseudalkalibacillus berkeleyi]|uniref:Indole-3-glycerol phosphate synthase n=1 Tax=Pseudalkalibacillus berkeleyi TaxID=1069813 RepID=A0ABS9H0S5_9BACL|nr:indole-3-glycerol phosphate synthase TrpC [Pseudalkalibacillus berkeleyi]MCF6137435.1 indole-3-glycerol phosphate synthase TrpC [Pseudalkalibacillus berkeleyi]
MLNRIVETKIEELKSYPKSFNTFEFEARSLSQAILRSNNDIGLISEVKKASPSKGVITEDFDPTRIAESYEKAGADAISVLTDREYFLGAPDYLTQIRKSVGIPILRKDFIIDPIQVIESRAIGADAILLIQAILEPNQANELFSCAKEQGLEVLLEVHSLKELEIALQNFTPNLLGINNRDLNTFKTSVSHTTEIAKHVPVNIPFISESGIVTREDVTEVQSAGAKGILVGETLMRSKSIKQSIAQLVGTES